MGKVVEVNFKTKTRVESVQREIQQFVDTMPEELLNEGLLETAADALLEGSFPESEDAMDHASYTLDELLEREDGAKFW